jgi:hypothetical protein
MELLRLKELREWVARIEAPDEAFVTLPEGIHSSCNLRYRCEVDEDGDPWVHVECD